MKCPRCPSKSYFGTLKAAQLPTDKVKPGRNDRCPNCGEKLEPTLRTGQTLVEFALVLPIFLFLLLGFGETAFLVATQHGYQNGVDVLAQRAAAEMATEPGESWQADWNQVVRDEQDRHDCSGTPSVTLPDGTHGPGDRVIVHWQCHYQPRITTLWGGLPISVESEAVVPQPAPTATPSPAPSPS
jgi:hypothetical protein